MAATGAETRSTAASAAELRAAAPRLLAIAAVILGDRRDAEDAVQEAMFTAWRKWDQLRDRSRRDPWLTRICVRESLRVRRRRSVLGRREVEITDSTAPAATDAEMVLWDDAFARLSRQQRAVVLLHYRYRYTLDECADLMGCRPGSARQHLARALNRLRQDLA